MIRFCLALAALIISSVSQAYLVATPPWQGPLDPAKPVRILLSGRGSNLGIQPQQAARTTAMLYHRNFPKDQIVLITVLELSKDENKLAEQKKPLPKVLANEENLKAWGWKFVTSNNVNLETTVATKEMMKFAKIQSLDIYGHNSPSLGTQSDGLGFRFDTFQPIVGELKSRFLPLAFAWIHGCNSGWLMAQDLSKKWGIAVAGSFTGTRFERLHSDGHFYVYDETKAPSAAWAKSNPEFEVGCEQGGCIRMHPAFSPYNGHWGNFSGPMLSHYHFFCQGEMKDCEKRMALALYGYVSEKSLTPTSSIEDFKAVAKDYLCPVYKDRVKTNECHAALEEISSNRGNIRVAFEVNAPQLKCDIRSCTGKMTCDSHACKIEGRESLNASTLAQDYMHFIRGYQALKAEGL